MRSRRRCRTTRAGFTLIELVASLGAASVLIVGLSSALLIALRATDSSSTPAPATLGGHARLTDMHSELQHAQSIIEQTTTAITVSVPDRDDPDSYPETIRYAWSGTPGDPLTRQYNGGTVANAAEDVHDFDIQYYQPASEVEYLTVRLQISSDARASTQTAIPLFNRP